MLPSGFFNQPANDLAIALLGTVIHRKVWLPNGRSCWLSARIIETEAYFASEKASHSSLGYTDARRAMFMPPGTIYMYYARGGDSLNFSAQGKGDAVLIKSALPVLDSTLAATDLHEMQRRNPGSTGPRPLDRLCRGQTLLCRSLDLKVPDWNARQLNASCFFLERDSSPGEVVVTRRLGIPANRDAQLLLRFLDREHCRVATKNPLTVRGAAEPENYVIATPDRASAISRTWSN